MTVATSRRMRTLSMEARSGLIMFGVLILGILMIGAVTAFSPEAREVLRYEREAVSAGEWWRLVAGHLVHGDTRHLVLNVLGTALMWALFPTSYRIGSWLAIVLLSIIAIDLGLLLFDAEVVWYVGVSGVLHGVLAAGAVSWWRQESPGLAVVLTLILLGKLAWEQWQGALPLATGLAVIVEAHLYGALGGALAAFLLALRESRTTAAASL